MANLCPGRRVPALLWWDVVWSSVACSLRAAEHLLSVWQEMSSHPHAVTVSGGQGWTKDTVQLLAVLAGYNMLQESPGCPQRLSKA